MAMGKALDTIKKLLSPIISWKEGGKSVKRSSQDADYKPLHICSREIIDKQTSFLQEFHNCYTTVSTHQQPNTNQNVNTSAFLKYLRRSPIQSVYTLETRSLLTMLFIAVNIESTSCFTLSKYMQFNISTSRT